MAMETRTEKRKRVFSTSKWACLPNDLLVSILDKSGLFLSDYIRFSSECKSWNSVALSHEEKRKQLSNHQLPWLMICYSDLGGRKKQRSLYNFSSAQISNLDAHMVSKYKHRRCYGSSHGWLIFLIHTKFQLVLLNPFSDNTIRLPPIIVKNTGSSYMYIKNVILSRDPFLSSFEVLAAFSVSSVHVVAHLKFGDEFWTYSESGEISRHDLIFTFYKGRILCGKEDKILSLNVVVDCSNEYSRRFKIEEVASSVFENYTSSYFVESINGDLLIIYKSYSLMENILRYNIFKIVDSNGKFDCIPVINLDGQSLFLDMNQSISVSASNYPGCRPNSIYILYDYLTEEFNMEDRSVQGLTVQQRFGSHVKRSELMS